MAFERAAITKDYLYSKNWLPELPATPPGDVVRVPSYQAMQTLYEQGNLQEKYADCFFAPRPAEELFRLKNDWQCMHNLALEDSKQKALHTMRQALDDWQKRTSDHFPGKENLKKDIINRKTGERLEQE